VHAKTRNAYNLAAQKYCELFHNELEEKQFDRDLLDAFTARLTQDAVVCDAGCGPSAHIGRYVSDKGTKVVGVDISDQCVEMARCANPEMRIEQGDLAKLAFEAGSFDGVISYYSIIHTPKNYVASIFDEFHRVLKPGGHLLVAVKAGATEGYIADFLGTKTEIYFTLFSKTEVTHYLEQSCFQIEFIEKRTPYDFEIQNERIFAIGRRA
jgi:SAM-dependent methyltransferase